MAADDTASAGTVEPLDDRRVFISYSRSETPLVEDLADGLRERGLRTFLDFRDLVPGGSWDDQLRGELRDARAVVLVVSDRSVWGSENTAAELQQTAAHGTYVVLALADPVPIPPALASAPFVDLRRGRFNRRLDDLVQVLEEKQERAEELPRPGWRRPPVVWLAVVLAVAAALLSLLAFWTVVLPLVLLPLPMRILQREFDYARVRAALAALLVLLISFFTGFLDTSLDPVGTLAFLGMLPVGALLLVLRSASFRRWMQPVGARPRLRRLPPASRWEQPSRRRFLVHAAPQDGRYVDEVVRGLQARRFGHRCSGRVGPEERPSTDPDGYDIVLRFVSRFNDEPNLLDGALTLPVLLSDPDDDLPVDLQKTQWIDFRHGGRRRRRREIEHLAACFDRPPEILRRLGATPPFNDRRVPRGVRLLVDLLPGIVLLLVPLAVAAITSRATLNGPDQPPIGVAAFVNLAVSIVVAAALAGFVTDRLAHRRPTRRFSLCLPALYGVLLWTALSLSFVAMDGVTWSTGVSGGVTGALAVIASYFSFFVFFAFPVLWLATRREASMWVPRVRELGGDEAGPWAAVVAAITSLRTVGRQAWRDATGVSVRADLRRRRERATGTAVPAPRTPTAGVPRT